MKDLVCLLSLMYLVAAANLEKVRLSTKNARDGHQLMRGYHILRQQLSV